MNTKNWISLISGAGLLLAASPLMANTIDNINVPTSPGNHVYNGSLTGQRAGSIGDTTSGEGTINGIDQGGGPPNICGSGNCALHYEFSGFKLDRVAESGTVGLFTGGQVTFTANGSQNFLTATPDPLPADPTTAFDDTQYTLIATKVTGAQQNGAFGLLSVTSGDAFSLLDNNGYHNGGGGMSDLLFNTSWAPTNGDFNGSNDIHFMVSSSPSVPGPSGLGLLVFGLGLIGFGTAVRRRKNA